MRGDMQSVRAGRPLRSLSMQLRDASFHKPGSTALTGAVTLPADPFGGTARNWGWQHTCFRLKGPDGLSHLRTWAPRAVGQEPSPWVFSFIKAMKFKRVLRETLRFWPSQIPIADGKPTAGGGGVFPQLSRLWDRAEAHAQAWSEAHQLMVWAVFCAWHKAAVLRRQAGQDWVAKADLDGKYLRRKYEESLFAPGSAYPRQMLRAYRREVKARQGRRRRSR